MKHDTTPVVGDVWKFPDFSIRITGIEDAVDVEYTFIHNQKARVVISMRQWRAWILAANAERVG